MAHLVKVKFCMFEKIIMGVGLENGWKLNVEVWWLDEFLKVNDLCKA